MSLLSLHNIHKSYGENIILSGVSLQLHRGEKVGLVGPNGAGKTTLLKIIIGEEEADEGQVFLAKGLSPGYLSQKPGILPRATLKEHLLQSRKDIIQLGEELASLEREMALPHLKKDNSALSSLMERYGQVAHLFEEKGGYTLENRLKAVIRGLGFHEKDLERRLADFSGGEKTRAQLASLLLREADLLLLDEPTNYLDMDALEWLENYLRDWAGSLLVVSHDRYFLDRVVNRICALQKGGIIKSYPGNYSSYLAQKQLEKVSEEKAYKKQQAAINKDLEFIRNAAGDERTKRQARSREKRLAALNPTSIPIKEKSVSLNFDFAGRSGKIVVAFENVAKAFGEKKLFENASFEVNWGDRVALVGPNGAGKTTLLRMITEEETRSSGRVRVGPSVKIAYFDQEQKELDPHSTPLKTIMDAWGLPESKARNHLARYLFQGDEVFKKVEDLSGGEKSRLALAKIALAEGNFLILDEPTNHLDIAGVEELEAALASYPGTLLVVSHDRYFISRMATKVLEIREGKVKLYKGTYREYEGAKLNEMERKALERLSSPETLSQQEKKEKEKEKREKILLLRRQKRTLEKRLQEIEEEINKEEEEISFFQDQLADPVIYDNFDEARRITEDYKAARERVNNLYEEWETALSQLEGLPEEE